MSEWQETTLETIAEVNPLERLPTGTLAKKMAMEALQPYTKKISGFVLEEYKGGTKFKNGDTLIARITPCLENGKTAFVDILEEDEVAFGSTEFIVLREKAETSDKQFLYYFATSPIFREVAILSMTGSSGRQRVQTEVVTSHLFDLPPLPEQRAIAEVLSSLDDKIDLLHRQNQTLEALAETLFRQWFIEEADPEWEERPLDKVADYLNGLACQKYPPQKEEGKLPVLKIRELKGGIGQDSDWVRSNVPEQYLVHAGDVIFSWSASLLVKLWGGQTCVLNQHLFKVTSTEFPKWYYYLWTKHHLDEFIAIAETMATTMGHIKRSDLASCLCVIPDSESLAKMNSVFKPLLEKLQESDKQIRHLEKTRDELLPKLMSGEVRVNQINLKGETQ
jgi:type I restriction enzyme S subunit